VFHIFWYVADSQATCSKPRGCTQKQAPKEGWFQSFVFPEEDKVHFAVLCITDSHHVF
jgi:hypothetical protein